VIAAPVAAAHLHYSPAACLQGWWSLWWRPTTKHPTGPSLLFIETLAARETQIQRPSPVGPMLIRKALILHSRINRAHPRAMAALAGRGAEARRVAVVGGGVSGLFCASTLSQYGYHVSLFDMGKAAPGTGPTRGAASAAWPPAQRAARNPAVARLSTSGCPPIQAVA
jgi:hypothetical protein